MIGNNLSKILSFIVIVLIARNLEVDEYGVYTLVIGFSVLFTIITDFGIRSYLGREIARKKKEVNKLISAGLLSKTLLSIIAIILGVIIARVLSYDNITIKFIFISLITMSIQSLTNTFDTAYKAFEKMYLSALIVALRSLIRLIFIAILIIGTINIENILYLFLVATTISFIISGIMYAKKIAKPKISFELDQIKNVMRKAVPFGIAGVVMTIYAKIDVIMLSKMVFENTEKIIAYYSSAYTIIEAAEFIPIAIAGSFSPIAARAIYRKKDVIQNIFSQTQQLFILIAIPLAILVTAQAEFIITTIFGQNYLEAAEPLKILSWSWIFYFQIFCIGIVLNSLNKEKKTLKIALITLVMNIMLNTILIPLWSYTGAAIATVISELTYTIGGYYYIRKEGINFGINKVGKITFAISILVITVLLLRNFPVISTIAGIITYSLALVLLKIIPKEIISSIKGAFVK